jgi:hypothetical protein
LTEKPSAFDFQNSQHFLSLEAFLGGVLELGHIGKAERKGILGAGARGIRIGFVFADFGRIL